MIVTLPNRTDIARYLFLVTLSSEFRFRFYFNRRDQHWYFDIQNPDGTQLRSGIKVVADFPLLKTWAEQTRPIGELLAIDAASDVDPGIDELGGRTLLVYDDESV